MSKTSDRSYRESILTFRRSQSAFTIVELLIVIVVIAILATITIVAYNGIQNNARISSLTSDLDNASRKLKLYQVDNASYPTAIDCSASPAANTICLQPSSGTTYGSLIANNSITPQGFCIAATNNGTTYFITQDGTPQSGGCAVVNLISDPNMTNAGSYWNNWGTGGAGSATVGTAAPMFGNGFKRMTWSTAPTGSVQSGLNLTPDRAIVVGATYYFSIYIRQSWASLQSASFIFTDSGGASLGTTAGTVSAIQRSVFGYDIAYPLLHLLVRQGLRCMSPQREHYHPLDLRSIQTGQ